MGHKLTFALICFVTMIAAAPTPAAAQDIIGREAARRCRAMDCAGYSSDEGRRVFVIQNATYGQSVVVCGPAYEVCRLFPRAVANAPQPTVETLLPPLPPSPPLVDDGTVKDEPDAELDGAADAAGPVQNYQIAPGALQRQNE